LAGTLGCSLTERGEITLEAAAENRRGMQYDGAAHALPWRHQAPEGLPRCSQGDQDRHENVIWEIEKRPARGRREEYRRDRRNPSVSDCTGSAKKGRQEEPPKAGPCPDWH
jgi:hypothetical protein